MNKIMYSRIRISSMGSPLMSMDVVSNIDKASTITVEE